MKPELPLDLNSNPLSIVRGLPTIDIPTDKIQVRADLEIDPIFEDKYLKTQTGKTKSYATRISISKIKPGFYKPSKSGLVYKCDKPEQCVIDYIKNLVRSGHRPALFLYHNIHDGDDEIFLCPDDVASFYAYRDLGVSKPPVILLGSKKYLEESCYVIRAMKCTHNDYTEHFDSFFGVSHKLQPSLLGEEKPQHDDCFKILIEATRETKAELKDFHKGGSLKMHYHHTLYSILHRAEETLVSMQMLFERDLFISAAMLARPLYELALTFYIDWLAPEQVYKYLQLASIMKERDWEKMCEKDLVKQTKSGLSRVEAQKLKDAKIRGYRLASKVSEKAKMFPFGEEHHRDVYAFLSKIGHHDFSMTARYTHTLEHGDESVFYKDAMDTTIYCADFFVTSIITRVSDDIGRADRMRVESERN